MGSANFQVGFELKKFKIGKISNQMVLEFSVMKLKFAFPTNPPSLLMHIILV